MARAIPPQPKGWGLSHNLDEIRIFHFGHAMSANTTAEERILRALLHAEGASVSLTGITLMTNLYDIEEVNAIVQRLCLKRLVSVRNVSDSINGNCAGYYIGRNQRQAAKNHLLSLSSDKNEQADASSLSRAEREIVAVIMQSDTPQTVEQINAICKKGVQQLTWRLERLARKERISSRLDQGRVKRYFLNEEQALAASIECESEYSMGVLSKNNLREIVNDLSHAFNQAQQERKALGDQISKIERDIRAEELKIKRTQEAIQEKEEKLQAIRLTSERLQSSLGLSLSQSQKDPVRIAERLSFLRGLQARPALASLSTLAEVISDYEVALSITRNDTFSL